MCVRCVCMCGEITMECTVIGARCSNRTIYLIMYKVIRRKQQQNVFLKHKMAESSVFFMHTERAEE